MPRIPEPFIRRDYRGLNDEEDRLLRELLRRRDDPIDRLETQVRVGPGELLPDDQPDAFRRSWQESSKFKIDAIVQGGGLIQLVELKDLLRTSHLGQLLSYRYWHSLERDPQDPVQPVGVAPDVNPGAVQPARFHNVELVPLTQAGVRHFQQGLEAAPPFDPPGTE